MRRLIVHVGPHKTGSTSIQRALFFAADELLKLGIYYPSGWITSKNSWSHYALFEQLRSRKLHLVNNTAAQVLRTSADTIVLSAEDFSLLNAEELHAMLQAFHSVEPSLNICIVFYVRRWSGLIPSVVQELIKQGVPTTLGDVIARELLSPEQSDTINYVNRLDRFSAVFGAGSVNIIAFDNIAESKQNLVDHFFRTMLNCAIDSNTYDIETQHNNSLTIIEVEFLRARNCLVKNGSIPKFAGNADEYLSKLRATHHKTLADVMNGAIQEFVIDEDASPFRALYDLLNNEYHTRFLNPVGSNITDPLFYRTRKSIGYVNPSYLCDVSILNSMIVLNKNINEQTA